VLRPIVEKSHRRTRNTTHTLKGKPSVKTMRKIQQQITHKYPLNHLEIPIKSPQTQLKHNPKQQPSTKQNPKHKQPHNTQTQKIFPTTPMTLKTKPKLSKQISNIQYDDTLLLKRGRSPLSYEVAVIVMSKLKLVIPAIVDDAVNVSFTWIASFTLRV